VKARPKGRVETNHRSINTNKVGKKKRIQGKKQGGVAGRQMCLAHPRGRDAATRPKGGRTFQKRDEEEGRGEPRRETPKWGRPHKGKPLADEITMRQKSASESRIQKRRAEEGEGKQVRSGPRGIDLRTTLRQKHVELLIGFKADGSEMPGHMRESQKLNDITGEVEFFIILQERVYI